VSFGYLAAGRSSPQQRMLEPWGVVNRRGRWYVVGQDLDRGEQRVFRLSRISGEVAFRGPAGSVTVPAGTDVRGAVRAWDTGSPAPRTCLLRIRAGAGHGLRRHALSAKSDAEPGWDLVETSFAEIGWWSEHVASFGADVVVLEPVDLRDAVIGRLKGVLA
jgi:proteasome accessory factor B